MLLPQGKKVCADCLAPARAPIPFGPSYWDVIPLFQVLVSIQSMILVTDPYYNEPGWEVRVACGPCSSEVRRVRVRCSAFGRWEGHGRCAPGVFRGAAHGERLRCNSLRQHRRGTCLMGSSCCRCGHLGHTELPFNSCSCNPGMRGRPATLSWVVLGSHR